MSNQFAVIGNIVVQIIVLKTGGGHAGFGGFHHIHIGVIERTINTLRGLLCFTSRLPTPQHMSQTMYSFCQLLAQGFGELVVGFIYHIQRGVERSFKTAFV